MAENIKLKERILSSSRAEAFMQIEGCKKVSGEHGLEPTRANVRDSALPKLGLVSGIWGLVRS